MTKTVIRCTLDEKSVDKAIHNLNKFKVDFQKKVDTYRKKMAKEVSSIASVRFASATMEHNVKGISRKPNVKISVTDNGSISVIVAQGEDAVWCEFGSGVYYNGSAGSSPNPYGKGIGFTIGSYGKGFGKRKAWGYYDDKGELVITRGTPASMPMYNAAKEVTKRAIEIAREVFK